MELIIQQPSAFLFVYIYMIRQAYIMVKNR